MAHPHIPDLTAIKAIQNQELKFYAIIGAVVSLSAGLELTFLDIFITGLSIKPDTAARILFTARAGSIQRDMAAEAMSCRMKGQLLETTWDDLSKRIDKATGTGGTRHLLAHNAVRAFESGGGGFGMGAFGEGAFGDAPQTRFFVEQDRRKVLAGTQKAKQADFDAALAYCEEIIGLLRDLDDFLAQIP